jgi:exodeoxyribonuclease V alpha subunit
VDKLVGSIERVTYYNPENGYSVLRLQPDRGRGPGADAHGLVTVTGNLPELAPGEHLTLSGRWVSHPKHGVQFQVEICEQTLPATLAGIRRYLGSGLVRGIGPRLAERIVQHFGHETLQIIEEAPQRLAEVTDIGATRSRWIAAAWQEQKQVKEIMLFLHSHGVSTNLAVKIYKQYGDQALAVVQNDPYRLARDIYGIGFKTADKIARALGLPVDHPSRIEAGILFVLGKQTDDGHVYLPLGELTNLAAELLGIDSSLIAPALERLAAEGRVEQEVLPLSISPEPTETGQPPATVEEAKAAYGQPAVYLAALYASETGLANSLRSLADTWPTRLSDVPPAFIDLDPALSEQQRQAIRSALGHPLSVLTGGPGTGKTTAIRALIAGLESAQKRYALASPTGRAAKRLSQATGRPASTLHRLLGFAPGEGFKFNANNPLPVDFLVVDEASMLDVLLANHLLKALRPGVHLLLVGDVDQLPSVGAGDVLRDVIASGAAAVTRLEVIFRQAASSHIITNAHRINKGQMPVFTDGPENGDFFLFPADAPDDAAQWVENIVCKRIPAKFGFHPRDQIQVLAPMYRGPAGVDALNTRLQAALNPPGLMKAERTLYGRTLRVGDKLMQVQNNYDKDVFNGDIGYLFAINPVDQTLTIDFDGRGLVYDWSEADQLVLAYAVSVHKAQGSEFPVVVIPLVTQHYLMLQRNLLYTAVTRARQLCVLVGSKRAINIAVHTNKVTQRYTALDWRLSDGGARSAAGGQR